MVRIHTLVLSLTLSALGATTQNDRRGVDVLARARIPSQGSAVMGLHTRKDEKPSSAAIKKLEEDRRVISPELDQAWEKMKTAIQAAEDAISDQHKEAEKRAMKELEAAFLASDNSIPQEIKQKQDDAVREFEATRDGLPEETKSKLEENRLALEEARERESASESDATSQSDSEPDSTSSVALGSTPSVTPES
ncbi:hypothetical protein ISF_08736 [Cordyceps fumosorosea ARSEF 2679]|uniref:Uncharacterized protein n=1 Tax=Cordyceps fumosorosea (strain ARSEF 2679) TaxID=1081104 RepID=A0A162I836_CORFA|nr:hypothetical protein ISF_08736 [Cordyceps fumosorosea ARSEF 2679]OAA53575.1 hypothetical protein ISF_08736 [Cordyceps fumosorosea ARSEF 2679]